MRSVLVTAQSSAMAGVERRLVEEIRVLRSMGLDVIVAPSRFPQSSAFKGLAAQAGGRLIEWHPYKFIERGHVNFACRSLAAISSRKIQNLNLRLAHVALPWTRVGLSRVHELARMGVPVVLGLHCTYPKEVFSSELRNVIRAALGGVVGAYAVSESVRESFGSAFSGLVDHFDVRVIRNGIDLDRFAAMGYEKRAIRAELELPEGGPVLIFCGRLDEFKDPLLALEIADEVMHRISSASLLIVGDGPLREQVDLKVKQMRGAKRVRCLGYQSQVERFLSIADIYLSTSGNGEGCPLAPAEALACGLPIVIPNWPAFRQTFDGCQQAVFVEGRLVASWVAAIENTWARLRSESTVASLAREYVARRLNVSGMRDRLVEFYEEQLRRIEANG